MVADSASRGDYAELRVYIEELRRWKGLPPINLIRPRKPGETVDVENAILAAVKNSEIVGMAIPSFIGSNQAKGNKAADFFIATASPSLPANSRINVARGRGLPRSSAGNRRDTPF